MEKIHKMQMQIQIQTHTQTGTHKPLCGRTTNSVCLHTKSEKNDVSCNNELLEGPPESLLSTLPTERCNSWTVQDRRWAKVQSVVGAFLGTGSTD